MRLCGVSQNFNLFVKCFFLQVLGQKYEERCVGERPKIFSNTQDSTKCVWERDSAVGDRTSQMPNLNSVGSMLLTNVHE